MIFVIDTSELHDQKRLEGSLFRLFLFVKTFTNHRVCIPEVVLAEHRRASRKAMEESAASIEKQVKVLARYWDKFDIKIPSVEREFEKWRLWIDERLRVAGIEILPYPTAPHESFARRDLARRKPFNEHGKGYRDALIWESVLELAGKSTDQVVFISSNSSDFSQAEKLHPDLMMDLVERSLDSRVTLALGLKSALDQHLNHLLPLTDKALRDALERGPADGIDLNKWTMQELKDVCPKLFVPPAAGVEYDHLLLSAVRSVESLKVREARRFQSGEVFVEFDLGIKASVLVPSDPFSQAIKEGTSNGWKLVGTLLANFLQSHSLFRMTVALTFGRDRSVLGADVWDLSMSGPLDGPLPKPI